jgi:hypothetical protein
MQNGSEIQDGRQTIGGDIGQELFVSSFNLKLLQLKVH